MPEENNMDKLVIEGGVPLKGEVTVSGAKNSVLPILAATLLTDDTCTILNVPHLSDTFTIVKLLRALGKSCEFSDGKIQVSSKGVRSDTADYKLVSTMRGSFCVLGPLLARLGRCKVSLPGGCVIGSRPVDLHLKGIKALGAKVDIEGGYVIASAKKLKGAHIYLGGIFGSSVLATANVMMAAVLARGKTVIESAACEPEIADLAGFLIKMGARINGHGTPIIEIEGVDELGGAEHSVIPDRIEAGTFIAAALITKGNILLRNGVAEHQGALIDGLRSSGARIDMGGDGMRVKGAVNLRPMNITTYPYPGFPTDMQAQMVALACVTRGISVITDKVFPDRFMHIAELMRMGAKIQRQGNTAVVEGCRHLSGADVMASDLRASAALVLAGLVAKGRTTVFRIYHLDRGYDKLDGRLRQLGARISREKQ